MSDLSVEIVCVSSEVLLGEILDSNSHWLAQQFTRMGVRVRRRVQLPSDRDQVVEEYRRFLNHDADLLVLTGGLGPTDEDNTLNYLAAATERPFEVANSALEMIQDRYDDMKSGELVETSQLNESRKKMSYMPRGGVPLGNPVGVAPGLFLKSQKRVIIALPGDPEEMMAIFSGEDLSKLLEPLLVDCGYAEGTLMVNVRNENLLIPAMRHVRQRHPQVSIRALSQHSDQGLNFRIHLSAFAEEEDLATEASDDAPDNSTSDSEKIASVAVNGGAEDGPVIIDTERRAALLQRIHARVEDAQQELCDELDTEGLTYSHQPVSSAELPSVV
jgi:molybdenum cofactor synthesis domain-containing protein